MEEKKALIVDFDLSGLRLGMTVYHPNVGFGREPVKLYGVRVSAKGDSARVELKYADGSCLWEDIDWLITSDNLDCSDDKPYYICRWLNHSFMPFTKRNQDLYEKVREKYDRIKGDE